MLLGLMGRGMVLLRGRRDYCVLSIVMLMLMLMLECKV